MSGRPRLSFGFFVPLLAALLLVIAVSCGGGATPTTAPEPEAMMEEPTAEPEATVEPTSELPQVHLSPTATPAPVAGATATAVPEVETTGAEPYGTLNVAHALIGPFSGHTRYSLGGRDILMRLSSHEGLLRTDADSQIQPIMVEDWSIAGDNRKWTFNLKRGIQFHGGWGELTPEDIIYSTRELVQDDGRCGCIQGQGIFENPDGYWIALDNYTMELDTGIPAWDVLNWLHMPACCGAHVFSKTQWDALRETLSQDEAIQKLVGTGPWEVTGTSTDLWEFKAVTDHYRKIPEFAEMRFVEIPEEATRVANFQTGKIDFWQAAPDSLPVVAEDPDTKFMSQKGTNETILIIWGNFYHYIGTDQERPGYDPDLPWISSNPDVNSPEWERARKVREAVGLAINRQKLVDELLAGEGEPGSMYGWQPFKKQWQPGWEWDYDLDRAKELMREAGYEEGFDVAMTPAEGGTTTTLTQACDAVAAMLGDININARVERADLQVLYASYKDRSYEGFTCEVIPNFGEPISLHRYSFDPTALWGVGWDHPWYTERLLTAFQTFDAADRWNRQVEMGQWVRDNVMGMSLFGSNVVFPLGPKLDPWEEHLSVGTSRGSAFEFARHRQ